MQRRNDLDLSGYEGKGGGWGVTSPFLPQSSILNLSNWVKEQISAP